MSVSKKDKPELVEVAKKFEDCGFGILATGTTYELLKENGIKAERINKMQEGKPNIVDAIINGKIQLIINTPATSRAMRRHLMTVTSVKMRLRQKFHI